MPDILTLSTTVGAGLPVECAAQVGTLLGDRLLGLTDTYEVVGDVRGRGLLRGLELVTDKATKARG